MATSQTKKVIAAGLCAATMIGVLPASITPAEAMHRGFHHGGHRPVVVHRHRHRGGAVAAGVIGGLAIGALAASAARPAYAYPSYGYGYGGGYYQPNYYRSGYYGGYARDYYAPAGVAGGYYGAYDPGPTCFWTRRRVPIDPYTVVVRRVRVCE